MFKKMKNEELTRCAVPWCGKEFIKKTPWHKACSDEHAFEARLLSDVTRLLAKNRQPPMSIAEGDATAKSAVSQLNARE